MPSLSRISREHDDLSLRDVDLTACTSTSSGMGRSGQLLEKLAKGGDWQEGQRFSGGASQSQVTGWVDSLK